MRSGDGSEYAPLSCTHCHRLAAYLEATYKYRGAESEFDAEGWETVGDIGMVDEEG